MGCYYHACTVCCGAVQKTPKGELTFAERKERAQRKREFLEERGYEYIEIWGHEWSELKRTDLECQEIMKSFKLVPPMNVRDLVAGGRCEAFNLLKASEGDKKLCYLDVNSLYPAVCLSSPSRPFPVGVPTIIRAGFGELKDYFGICYVRVLPPQNLLLPVLQTKIDGQAHYTLCRACSGNPSDDLCSHSEKERELTGVYTTAELTLACSKGYKIQEFYEVWHYTESSTELFAGYIRAFYLLKVKNSGFPPHVRTEEDKDRYVEELKAGQDIDLRKEDITDNPTQRLIAKLALNSLWGRFALRSNLPTFEYVDSVDRMWELLYSGNYDISYLNILDEDTVQVQHTLTDDWNSTDLKSNCVIAGFVTSYARIRLYEGFETVGCENLCYGDTDSIICLQGPGIPVIKQGILLGEFKSELGDGEFMTFFVCIGPKAYAFKTNLGREEYRAKGVTVSHENKDIFQLDSLEAMVKDPSIVHYIISPYKIFRTKGNWELSSHSQTKLFRYTFAKRKIINDKFFTVPYGYIPG
jgi:hypothetical protein